MKEELSKLTDKIENLQIKQKSFEKKQELYKSAKNGFIDSFGMMSVVIIYVSLIAFFALDIIPSYISGFLALILNTIAIVLFIFALLNNKDNIRILNKTNLKSVTMELKKCEKDLKKYDEKYNEIIETAILGDNF